LVFNVGLIGDKLSVYGNSNELEERAFVIRFLEPPDRLTIREHKFFRTRKRSGHQDNRNPGILVVYRSEKFNAVQERHAIIGHHCIEMLSLQFMQGSVAIAGRDYGNALKRNLAWWSSSTMRTRLPEPSIATSSFSPYTAEAKTFIVGCTLSPLRSPHEQGSGPFDSER
jgi:hypothetical protein